jgi:hypothetical protein
MMMRLIQKINKSEDQFDLFGSGVSDESSESHHKYYKTLQDTEHSYQIIQGDLGLKLLLQNLSKQSSVCFDTELRTRCLACRVSRFLSLMRRERILRTLSGIRLKQKHSLKNLCLFRKRKIEKLDRI